VKAKAVGGPWDGELFELQMPFPHEEIVVLLPSPLPKAPLYDPGLPLREEPVRTGVYRLAPAPFEPAGYLYVYMGERCSI